MKKRKNRKKEGKLNSSIMDPVVQSVISLTSSLRVISFTVLADSIYNILIFFAEKMWVAFALHFFSKIDQHICISLHVNFNESLTNDIVSFWTTGPWFSCTQYTTTLCRCIQSLKTDSYKSWAIYGKKTYWRVQEKEKCKILKRKILSICRLLNQPREWLSVGCWQHNDNSQLIESVKSLPLKYKITTLTYQMMVTHEGLPFL